MLDKIIVEIGLFFFFILEVFFLIDFLKQILINMRRLISICSGFVSFCFNLSKFCIKNVAAWTEETSFKHGD